MSKPFSLQFDPIFFDSFCKTLIHFLNAEFPQIDLIHLWVVGQKFGIGKLQMEKIDEQWHIREKDLVIRWSDLQVIHRAKLTFIQHGSLPEEISPANEFHKIILDGEVFAWQKEQDLHQFINQTFKKRLKSWEFNASLSPSLEAFSKGDTLFMNIV